MLWRQGDIFIESTHSIPRGAVPLPEAVLAEGEVTGHRHRVADGDLAQLYEHRGELFLSVNELRARIVHDEHGTIVLPMGAYRVWRQREYRPMGQEETPDFQVNPFGGSSRTSLSESDTAWEFARRMRNLRWPGAQRAGNTAWVED